MLLYHSIHNQLLMHRSLFAMFLLGFPLLALADEGMWLFNQPPRQILKERYQFEPSDAWLEHLQKALLTKEGSPSWRCEQVRSESSKEGSA